MKLFDNTYKNEYINIINKNFAKFQKIKNQKQFDKFTSSLPMFGTYNNQTLLTTVNNFIKQGAKVLCNEIALKDYIQAITPKNDKYEKQYYI